MVDDSYKSKVARTKSINMTGSEFTQMEKDMRTKSVNMTGSEFTQMEKDMQSYPKSTFYKEEFPKEASESSEEFKQETELFQQQLDDTQF